MNRAARMLVDQVGLKLLKWLTRLYYAEILRSFSLLLVHTMKQFHFWKNSRVLWGTSMPCMVLLASTLCCPLMIRLEVPIFDVVEGGRLFLRVRHDAECLPCCPIGHVDEEVPQFLHAMLFICSNRPIFWSTFELVNVHLVLLFYPKDKTALALCPELVIDVGNLCVVEFLAGL